MKFLYVTPLLLSVTLGYKLTEYGQDFEQKQIYKKQFAKQLEHFFEQLAVIKNEKELSYNSEVDLNEFMDRLLPGVNKAILDAAYDPTSIPDEFISIGIGTSNLTEGTLSKVATMERYENVILSYNRDVKKLGVEFIIRWEDLQVFYKYQTKVLKLISLIGNVTADLEHLKIHLKFGFDFNTHHLSVDSLDFNHTGDITLTFSGLGLVDYITNAMTEVLTILFHNTILSVIKQNVMDPIQDTCDAINSLIDEILNQ